MSVSPPTSDTKYSFEPSELKTRLVSSCSLLVTRTGSLRIRSMTQMSRPATKAICLPSGVKATRLARSSLVRSIALATPSPVATSGTSVVAPLFASHVIMSKRRRDKSVSPSRDRTGNATPSSLPSPAPTFVTRRASPPSSGRW